MDYEAHLNAWRVSQPAAAELRERYDGELRKGFDNVCAVCKAPFADVVNAVVHMRLHALLQGDGKTSLGAGKLIFQELFPSVTEAFDVALPLEERQRIFAAPAVRVVKGAEDVERQTPSEEHKQK